MLTRPRTLAATDQITGRIENALIIVMILLDIVWLSSAVFGIREFGILLIVTLVRVYIYDRRRVSTGRNTAS